MSQPPAPVSMPQTPATPLPEYSSNIEGIFDVALKSYKEKTKEDLKSHDLFKQLDKCDSPAAILAMFQAAQFDPSRTGGSDRLKKWLVPTINVLYAFSATLSEGVGLVFPPAKIIFAGTGVLLLAAKDVAASHDVLIDIFGRIGGFFGRLEFYIGVPLTPAMTAKMVQITTEILDILATATKEMEQSRAKKFIKKVAGQTDLEDGLKKLEKLTNEEVVMATAQLVKVTHNIDKTLAGVDDNVNAVHDMVQTIAEDGKEVKSILRQTVNNVGVERNQLRASLRKWQAPPNPSTNHNLASDRQFEGTAVWFFENDKFEEWKVAGSLLWIHGKPGSGKSVLCSAIINEVTTLCEVGSASMAYFYFDFRDVDKQARRNLLSSLLVQLSDCSDAFCDILSRLYETHHNGARQPSDKALMQCLEEMLTLPNQGPVYLIVDALDECPDTSDVPSAREQVLDLIKNLIGLRLPSLHICVTSRPEVDIGDSLESLASQTVSLQDEPGQNKDIADYVRSVVYPGSGKFMRRWKKEDKELVIKTLSERADGMFRWVFCQLEMLRNCPPHDVRRALRELPKSLDETYERMLREIGKADPHQAHRLLQILSVATRPLRVDELAEVLALDFDNAKEGIPVLNKDWRWENQQHGVLSTCSSLIVVTGDDTWLQPRVVQFAHFSVKEFLTSERLANLQPDISLFYISPEPAHTVIAQVCLAILLQSDCDDGSSPLSKYAALHWVDHAQFGNVSLHVEDGLQRLFDPAKPNFMAWYKSYYKETAWQSVERGGFDEMAHIDLSPESPSSTEAYASLCLYFAAFYGFRYLTKHLIAEYPQHVNARVGLYSSPLVAALRNRHIQVAELLHQYGAVLHIGPNNCTLLHAASNDGSMDVAQWLLNIGADANAQQDDRRTPLHLAAANGHLELVRTLLGHGADVNAAATILKDTPLHDASERGHADVVRLLIQNGADASTDLQTLFFQALTSGSAETAQFFILLGADVNARFDWDHSTPLHVGSSWGSAEAVRLLIEHGADVNARDWDHSTPLHLASTQGNIETAQILVQNGADVHAQDQNLKTPLHLASSATWTAKIVRLLIDHGARVNVYDGKHKTPLQLLLYPRKSNVDSLRLLLENGADVDVKDDEGRTPFQIATSRGHHKIAQLLLDHRASVE